MVILLALGAALAADPWSAPEENHPAFKPPHPHSQVYAQLGVGAMYTDSVDTGGGTDLALSVGYRAKGNWGFEVGLGPTLFTMTEWQGNQGQGGARVLGGFEGRYFGLGGGIAAWWTPGTVRPWALARIRFGAIDGGMFQGTGAWGGADNGASIDVFGQLPLNRGPRRVWWTGHGAVHYLSWLTETGVRLRVAGDGGRGTVQVGASLGLCLFNEQFGPHLGLTAEARL